MRLFQKGDEIPLKIEDYTTEGNGVGHIQAGHGFPAEDPRIGFTVFVSDSLPGDQVLAEVRECKKNFARARLKKRIHPSPSRRKSPCPYSSICGGCGLIAWDYDSQLAWKEHKIISSLGRLADFSLDHIPMHGKETFEYRNKVNMRVDKKGYLAYSRPGTNKLFKVDQCLIAHPAINQIISRWNQLVEKKPNFSLLSKEIRMIIIRANEQGETMLHLISSPLTKRKRGELQSFLKALEVNVLSRSETKSPRDVRIYGDIFYLSQQKKLKEEILGNIFYLSPPSFFQVNRFLTEELYKRAISYFEEPEDLTILDLYCGIGTTSLALAKIARQVIGVELVASAVQNAKESARKNEIKNVSFIEARAEELLPQLLEKYKKEKLAILVDPPRKGLDSKLVNAIANSEIPQLVYISCNPATLARDAGILAERGYELKKVEGFDLFPETGHVESLALLIKDDKNNN